MFCPDITVVVDWALKMNYLSVAFVVWVGGGGGGVWLPFVLISDKSLKVICLCQSGCPLSHVKARTLPALPLPPLSPNIAQIS